MMDKKTFVLREQCHLDYMLRWIAENWKRQTLAGKPIAITATEAKRSLEQNSKLWALLDEVSEQVEWYGQHLTREEWKDVFSASLKRQKVVPGIDGGFVVCGQRTSQMTVRDMSELIELIHAFGAERNVRFSDGDSSGVAA